MDEGDEKRGEPVTRYREKKRNDRDTRLAKGVTRVKAATASNEEEQRGAKREEELESEK